MTAAAQLEILDLRHFSASQLRPLLEEEALTWERRLSWDYRAATQLLLEYLDSRILPGFVALDRGKLCGFTFCVYEGYKAVIGDAFSSQSGTEASLHVTETLLSHLIELLKHSPNIDRIEAQLLLYDSGELDTLFRQTNFDIHPRLFMEHTLNGTLKDAQNIQQRDPFPPFIELIAWSGSHYQAAAELIHVSYLGHIDARINDQYRTLEGSLRFLHNIVRFPGCGVFEPTLSWSLRDRRTGALVGIVLCSRISGSVAHITQLCVTPEYRAHGLGGNLLLHCAAQLRRRGFTAITLTVSEENGQAVHLYKALGFATRHRFDAMVFDRNA